MAGPRTADLKLGYLQSPLSTFFDLQAPECFLLEVESFYSDLSLLTAGLLFSVTFQRVIPQGAVDCGATKLYSFLCCSTVRVNFYLSLYLWHLPHTLSFLSLQVSSISGSTIIHSISEDMVSLFKIYLFIYFPGRDIGHQYVFDTGDHLCFAPASTGSFTIAIKSGWLYRDQ